MALYTYQPDISTSALTCLTTGGSPTVTSAAQFGSVLAGQRVFGAGIQFGTTVLSKTDASTITLSKPATATSGGVSLQFSYFTGSQAYTAGDVLGFPFPVYLKKINQIMVIDVEKAIVAVKLYFFSGPFAPTADNAAFAPADADARLILWYASYTNTVAQSANQIIYSGLTDLPILMPDSKIPWCQLVCVGTPTFAAATPLTVNFLGE